MTFEDKAKRAKKLYKSLAMIHQMSNMPLSVMDHMRMAEQECEGEFNQEHELDCILLDYEEALFDIRKETKIIIK